MCFESISVLPYVNHDECVKVKSFGGRKVNGGKKPNCSIDLDLCLELLIKSDVGFYFTRLYTRMLFSEGLGKVCSKEVSSVQVECIQHREMALQFLSNMTICIFFNCINFRTDRKKTKGGVGTTEVTGTNLSCRHSIT